MQSYGGTGSSSTNANKPVIFPRPATPWLLDEMPWKNPQPDGIMQFGSNYNIDTECSSKWPQHKRKSATQQASVLPPKLLITEERITQHFSGLQISGETKVGVGSSGNNNSVSTVTGGLATDDIPSTSTGKTHHPNPAYQMAAMELEQKLRNANRIVICDELKGGGGPVQGAIPPEWLMKTIPRPCTALVPWQPPALHLPLPPKRQQPPNQEPLDDYDDDLEFFENNNTCNVNLNKSDEQMDEDL